MRTAEQYIIANGFASWYIQHSKTRGEVVINYQDCLQAMVEFAREAIKADRENLVKHAKVDFEEGYGMVAWVNENSILNAPNITLM